MASNPVRDVSRLTENNFCLAFLSPEEEAAVFTALPAQYRPHFVVTVHTGLRWYEQMGLTWRYVDFLTGFLTVPRSKHGGARRVPMNSVLRSVLVDLATRRTRHDDPDEPVFKPQPKQSALFFPQAIQRAQAALREQGRAGVVGIPRRGFAQPILGADASDSLSGVPARTTLGRGS